MEREEAVPPRLDAARSVQGCGQSRLGELETAHTIGQLLDRYALEVIPTKAPKTQAGNNRALPTLRAVFGHLPLTPFKPRLVYQYVDRRGAKIAAHREIEVLSHAFTKAVEWGYIDRHPFKGEVRLEGEAPRTRYVEDWEVVEALALKPRRKAGQRPRGAGVHPDEASHRDAPRRSPAAPPRA